MGKILGKVKSAPVSGPTPENDPTNRKARRPGSRTCLSALAAATMLVTGALSAIPRTAWAQTTPAQEEARQLYTVARANLVGTGKTVLLAGEFYTTSHPFPGYGRRNAFIFQDYTKPGAQVDIYTNEDIPPANTQIWVRGRFVDRRGKAGKPIFVADSRGIGYGAPLPPSTSDEKTATTSENPPTSAGQSPMSRGDAPSANPAPGGGSNETQSAPTGAEATSPDWQKNLIPGLLGLVFLGAIGYFLWQTFGSRKPTATSAREKYPVSGAGGHGGAGNGVGTRPGEIDPLTSAREPMAAGAGMTVGNRRFPADPLTGDDPARYPSVRTTDVPQGIAASAAGDQAPMPAPVPESAASEGRVYFVEKVKPEELMASLGAAGSSGTPVAHGPFPAGTTFPTTPASVPPPTNPGPVATPVTPVTPIPLGNSDAAIPVQPVTPVTPVASPASGSAASPAPPTVRGIRTGEAEPPTQAAYHTVYSAPEGDDTVYSSDVRLQILPAWFEVVSGGADGLDTPGKRIPLWSLDANYVFGIARPTNNQDRIANFIPLLSRRVSRNVESQGDVVWDPSTSTATIRNFADPTQRKNPIRVQDRAMLVGEMRPLQDGDRIQIGDVILRYYASGGERMS